MPTHCWLRRTGEPNPTLTLTLTLTRSATFDANALLIQRIRQNLLNTRAPENALLLQILHSNLRTLVSWLEPEPELHEGPASLHMPPLRAGLGAELLALLDEELP